MSLRIETVTGEQIIPWLSELAELRISVFRDFPYLYDGSLDYEMDYLATYTRCAHSLCVLALEGNRVVGASTGLPLAEEVAEFTAPFAAAGLDTSRIFYCAESVLLPDYRGGACTGPSSTDGNGMPKPWDLTPPPSAPWCVRITTR